MALLFHATASAAELVGVYASPDVANSVEYRRVVDHLQGPISGDIRGTELTPIIAEWLSDDEEFTLDVEQIATSRDAVGYALFVSRLEHDVIPVTLLAGGGGYSVRIYVTVIMDFFADRGAFSATNRLESVHTVAITDGWLFPTGALLRARPDESQMTGYYEAALAASVRHVTELVARDSVGIRTRASRVFQVLPAGISSDAQAFIDDSVVGDRVGRRGLLEEELGYLLHERIWQELDARGVTSIALAPPESSWAVGAIAREIEDALPSGTTLQVGANSLGRVGLTISPVVERAAVIEGEGNAVGRQMFAAAQVSAVIQSTGEGAGLETFPRSLPESERTVRDRGAGGYIRLVGVPSPPVRGMWIEGYRHAIDALAPALVDQIVLASSELR